MPLTAGVPLGDRVVLLAGPVGPGGGLLGPPSRGWAWWIRAWRWTGWTGTCRVCRGSGIRRGLCGGAAAAGYGDAGFIPGVIQPGMMRPGTPVCAEDRASAEDQGNGGGGGGSGVFFGGFGGGGFGQLGAEKDSTT